MIKISIFKWLQNQGYQVNDTMLSYIDLWHSWYVGKVKDFHNYRVYNGQKHVDCQRLSLCMAKQVCQDWADLLLNEKVKINHPNKTTQDFIVSVLDNNNFWTRGNQAIEDAFWSGLVACIPYPDGLQIAPDETVVSTESIKMTFYVGNQIIPLTIDNGECTECAFYYEHKIADTVYIILRMCVLENGRYIITNKVFDKNAGVIEVENYSQIEEFQSLAPVWDTGTDIKPFVFIKPNNKNSIDDNSPFGMAVFSGAIDILKGLDTVYDSYINEYSAGKTRIIASADTMRFMDGKPVFDPDDIVFYRMPTSVNNETKIDFIQPAIRAMSSGIEDNLNLLSMRCGFGERHYNFVGGGVATATQVISENSHMFRTLKKHEIVLDAFFKDLCRLIIHYGLYYMGASLADENEFVTVDFDDSIIEDKQTVNNDMRMDVSAGLLKPELYIAKKYNVSLEEAREMIPNVQPEYTFGGVGE